MQDLAIANNGTNTVSVFLGKGDGSFRTRRDHRTRQAPISVAIGDLNGDRRPDLATVEYIQGVVSVLLNSGDGRFQTARDYRTGGLPGSLAIGDLNGDRMLDIVTLSGSDTASILLNATGRCAVPKVRGKSLPNAKRALVRANCHVGTIRLAYSKVIPTGHAISTVPRFGSVLPKGGKVNLVVSRGRN